MLVPVQGGVASLQKRNRMIQQQKASLATIAIPDVYVFNVSQREFRNRFAAGTNYNIPACPRGARHSKPVVIPAITLSEIDYADGGNNLGVVMNQGLSAVVGEQKFVGVANDVLGTDSTSPALGVFTTNLEWLGCFATANEEPTDEEIDAANLKLRQYMELVYSTGAELVQAGKPVAMIDRPLYNEAAEVLGRKPFWGTLDHTRASCPECHEDIIDGANFCKHCQQPIDPASVSARAKKRERDAAKMLKDEEVAS